MRKLAFHSRNALGARYFAFLGVQLLFGIAALYWLKYANLPAPGYAVDFAGTLSRLAVQGTLTETGFPSTIGKVNGVLGIARRVAQTSKDNLDNLTGAGSVPCIVPDGLAITDERVPFAVWNRGRNNLTGLEVALFNLQESRQARTTGNLQKTQIGTLNWVWPKLLPAVVPVLDDGRTGHYQAEITTQNGVYNEVINLRRTISGKGWAYQ